VIWTSAPEHQQISETPVLAAEKLAHKAFHSSPKAITFALPEARAAGRGKGGRGLDPDASTVESTETRDSGGARVRELESRAESQD